MTVLIPSIDSPWVTPFSREHLQPAGIALTLEQVYKFEGQGMITRESKFVPDYIEVETNTENNFVLKPGTYLVRYKELVAVPLNAIGLVLPRSTLLRMGANIDTAVWDPGYKGYGISRLTTSITITLEKGSRIAQIVFFKTEKPTPTPYNGSYQGEGT